MRDDPLKACPFLENPRPRCYCFDIQSIWISKVVEFCGGQFEQCKHFRAALNDAASARAEAARRS